MNTPHRLSIPSPGLVAAFGRLLIAVLFFLGASGLLAAPHATIAGIRSTGLPFAQLGYVIALVVEIAGGILLIVGYRTRLVGFALAVFTIVAGLMFHSNFADQTELIDFMKNVAIAGGLLQLTAFGGGALSLDARRRTRREASAH
jgi:putative oxidoreductase